MNPYETDELVTQYMEFHYGKTYYGVENYPAKCAQLCLQTLADNNKQKALDLGCAVGRTTFELAREFDEVIGLDLSARFIECATDLKEQGSLDYSIITQGELLVPCNADLSKLKLDEETSKVSFYQEDACNLAPHHNDYDLIFAGNLLDRLQNPKQFLSSVHNYLSSDGILVMSSPYTLLEEYTPRENWMGGFVENGEEVTVLEGMKKVLEPHFEMIKEPIDVPFVIRETKRKFQHTLAEMSFWQRK